MTAGRASLGALVLAAMVTGCGPTAEVETRVAGAALASTLSPSQTVQTFGFGSPASAARVALWDIDVKPDGEGLPVGRGTVGEGQVIYQVMCAVCHGATGVEGPNDRLVGTEEWTDWPSGRAVGNYWPYATTLFDYISKAMPQMTPGVLSADQTYAVIAYILNMNGLVGDDAVMDAEALPAVVMPARDRFVVDDRRGGPEVR